jgi:hypothetical protein
MPLSFSRKVFLSWILPANFFLSVYFVLTMTFPGSWISSGLVYVYILTMVLNLTHLHSEPYSPKALLFTTSLTGGPVFLRPWKQAWQL